MVALLFRAADGAMSYASGWTRCIGAWTAYAGGVGALTYRWRADDGEHELRLVRDERRLRGGCHNNWILFVRIWWRYGIVPDAHDGCIGFRLVLAPV